MEFVFNILVFSVPISLGAAVLLHLVIKKFVPHASEGSLSPQDWQNYKDRYQLYKDEIVQEHKSAADIGVVALRSSIILNGASAAATLAFIGRIWTSNGSALVISELVDVLSAYMVATLISALSTAFAYARMYFGTINWDTWKRKNDDNVIALNAANISQYIAIFLVLQSYVLFASGTTLATHILRSSISLKKVLLAI
ncbi:hypothetical protein ACFOY8_15865 [Thalassospira xianhensis]|uniref:Uncharacterized protein n=1 Tax=Thalassospira xianhensis MCCC 1A02616 TaxID=1177929 RepID=A0A367U9Q7_9PROT|nr:hypothetical protein [Thalassospira xianhensis]RCK05047.1 hypothetical protein TH5_16020 [Thalassospira xianhensis MCCC 1A02616]